jgi:hypothetical protein
MMTTDKVRVGPVAFGPSENEKEPPWIPEPGAPPPPGEPEQDDPPYVPDAPDPGPDPRIADKDMVVLLHSERSEEEETEPPWIPEPGGPPPPGS